MRHQQVIGPTIVSLLAFMAVIITVTACGTTEMRPVSSVAPAATDTTLSNSRRMVEEGRGTLSGLTRRGASTTTADSPESARWLITTTGTSGWG